MKNGKQERGASPRSLQQVGTLTDTEKSERALGKHFDECLPGIQNGPWAEKKEIIRDGRVLH